MNHLETKYLNECPPEFKPVIYNRYVDDTLASFDNVTQAHSFLQYINSVHPNIKFTMELESLTIKLAFLIFLLQKPIMP